MKKLSLLILFFFVVTGISFAQIAGSAHDFSSDTWNTSGEICITCHTPHNALSTDAPLWNHATTATVFTLYSSSTMTATNNQPSASSKMCLSCHDGTIALDSFGGATGTTDITGSGMLGTDLSDDHPISFTYDNTLATSDGGLFNPASALSGLGGTIDADMLFGGQMQCSSCHDVHNGGIDAGTALLLKTNDASALCLTCHDK